jgi:hypothetical protein
MSKPKQYEIGDRVAWNSGANSHELRKVGRVIEVVPAYLCAVSVDSTSIRNHQSYVVEVVQPPTKHGKQRPPMIYWPRVTHFRALPGRKPRATVADMST